MLHFIINFWISLLFPSILYIGEFGDVSSGSGAIGLDVPVPSLGLNYQDESPAVPVLCRDPAHASWLHNVVFHSGANVYIFLSEFFPKTAKFPNRVVTMEPLDVNSGSQWVTITQSYFDEIKDAVLLHFAPPPPPAQLVYTDYCSRYSMTDKQLVHFGQAYETDCVVKVPPNFPYDLLTFRPEGVFVKEFGKTATRKIASVPSINQSVFSIDFQRV